MSREKNISYVTSNGLCTSCGICKGVCGKKCITFQYGKERNLPVVDETKCIQCGQCISVCPGIGIQLNQYSKDLFATTRGIEKNTYCGYYLNTYTGYSTNEEIRYHSASGGMVTQFLLYLLDRKIIDGAVVVGYKKDDPLCPYPFIATTKEEIMQSRGSKYVVVSYDEIMSQLKKVDKRLVLVGLPCQIQGFRKLAQKSKKISRCIIGYFAIYCSLNKTKHSIDYYLYRYNVNRKEVSYFSFRDDGCLGYMKIADKKGVVIKKVPYIKYWHGTHSFFVNNRCILCTDHFGELADISFGDIHIEPFKHDTIGISSLITRSGEWERHLQGCFYVGDIVITPISIDTLVSSQIYSKIYKKGAGIKVNFLFRKLLNKPIPQYDVIFDAKITIKNILQEFFKYIMRSVGHHKSLWPLIKFMDRG
jgi:coenzyme F420 hydrogenase subunit beta